MISRGFEAIIEDVMNTKTIRVLNFAENKLTVSEWILIDFEG